MEFIRRKSLIYKSGVAENFYCLNHVLGCSHACRYPCYAFMMAKSHGRVTSEQEWCTPQLVGNALELLEKELPRLKNKVRQVHLCLTTDPFMQGYPEVPALSLRIIEKINQFKIPVTVLTKGILPAALGDKKLFLQRNTYGISLASLDEAFRRKWEPNTAFYTDRIKVLKYLHDQGFLTRVHMEPYPTPNIVEQSFGEIVARIAFVDYLYLGRWNYNQQVKKYPDYQGYYSRLGEQARRLCRELGIHYEGNE